MMPRWTRRRALKAGGVIALGAFATACARTIETPRARVSPSHTPTVGGKASADTPGLQGVGTGSAGGQSVVPAPGQVAITPNANFYTVAYSTERPTVPNDWKLYVGGLVDNPLVLTLDEIKQFPIVEEMRTFECISNPVGGTLIGNAIWKAIRLRDVLERARVQPTTRELKLESFDGYYTSIPLELGLNEHSLLAFEMNGEPLPVEHGYPLRCIWPGRYGMKQPKWLERITAIDDHFLGYWESQGWSNEARVLPNSRIDMPEDGDVVQAEGLVIRGVAFADGDDGIARIEVSYDDGKTWQEAKLIRGPNPYVWTNWEWQGNVPVGSAVLLARVTTNSGKTQQREQVSLFGGTFPNGTSAIHSVVVTIKG